jgi:hypothetical protein
MFYIIGSTRGPSDVEILEGLKKEAKDLGIHESVEFVVNADRGTILGYF